MREQGGVDHESREECVMREQGGVGYESREWVMRKYKPRAFLSGGMFTQ